MLEEDAEVWVGLRIDGGLEHREENVLQHFAKVGNKVPASEDVTKSDRGNKKYGILIHLLSVFPQAFMSESITFLHVQRVIVNLLDPGHLNHPFKVW